MTRYSRHPDLRLTELEGEGIVLHLGSRKYFSVSETGLTVLKAMEDGASTVSDLVDALTAEYDVDTDVAERSVREFIEKCAAAGLLSASSD